MIELMISQNKAHQTLAIFDVDGTLINGQTQNIFLNILRQEGVATLSDFILLSLWFGAYKLHFVKNTNVIRQRAYAKLKQRNVSEVTEIIERHFIDFQERIFSEARRVIKEHQQLGHDILLCSASIEPIIERIGQEFHITNYLCTELEIVERKFTGKIKGNAVYGSQKFTQLKAYLDKYQYHRVFYYTDHISDRKILEMVNIPICINPDLALCKVANQNKWEIRKWV